jgi:hypothetical protein
MSSKMKFAGIVLVGAAMAAFSSTAALARGGCGGGGRGGGGGGGGGGMSRGFSGSSMSRGFSGSTRSFSGPSTSFYRGNMGGSHIQSFNSPRVQTFASPHTSSFSHVQGNVFRGSNAFHGGNVPRIQSHGLNHQFAEHGFNHGHDFGHNHHDFDHHGFDRHNWWGHNWWGLGWWWPSWGWNWGGYYPWYSYDYYGYYPYWSYGYYDDDSPSYGTVVASEPEDGTYTSGYAPVANDQTAAVQTAAGGESDFYAQAANAFQQGDYRAALRFAGHAAVDNPRDPSVHMLLMLSMFAVGEYRGAAMEAHAVEAMDGKVDWPSLYAFYGNVDTYSKHLRALEQYVTKNPNAADGRILLGFQYMAAGHQDAARGQFLLALEKMPQDRIAAQLLTAVGGKVPENIQKIQSQAPQGGPGMGPGTAMAPDAGIPGPVTPPSGPPAGVSPPPSGPPERK